MENNQLNDRILRDKSTVVGLVADQTNYQPLEADIAPLRTEHAANTTAAGKLAQQVLATDTDDATAQKATAKKELKDLGERLAAGLQGYAASKTNPDPDLPGRVKFNRTDLTEADDASFATILHQLLDVATPLAAPLAQREFTAADRTRAEALLARFERKQLRQQETRTVGSTDRKTLLALVRRNASLIKEIRLQLKAYKNSPTKHAVWLRFLSYTKIINHRGGGGTKPTPPPQD